MLNSFQHPVVHERSWTPAFAGVTTKEGYGFQVTGFRAGMTTMNICGKVEETLKLVQGDREIFMILDSCSF